MTSDDVNTPYDSELPILAELERSWTLAAQSSSLVGERAAVGRERGAAARERAGAARARGAARRERSARVARRALALTGLGCLVAATAVATRSFVDAGEQDPTLRDGPTVRLAAGTLPDGDWQLDGYRRGDELCHDLVAAGQVATGCRPLPGARELHVDGTLSPRTRVVVGFGGELLTRVRVTAGATQAIVTTHALTTADGAGASSLPRAVRWFSVTLPRPAGSSPRRAAVTGYDVDGRCSPAGGFHGDVNGYVHARLDDALTTHL